MKNFLLLAFFILNSFFAFTQLSLGPHISAGAKTKENGVGVGLSGEATISIFRNGNLRFFSGYTQFPGTPGNRVKYVPIRAGYQHEIFNNRFILLGDIGTGTVIYPTDNYTGLSYGAGAGYKIPLSKNFFQFSIFYEHTKHESGYWGWVSYRLAYGVNFKK